ncbi:hypothetical protein Pmani_034107 [Petrolisthes manimaculis]|uniref:Nuclear protein MDM1 n=1 Tax=Petrolisthes manimaculis TaxID=1843537 RepID=A0AAE1TRY7_9EUCA|nr:hypothetical protein Pmani_034107 [Petrolisthes manimaculis]
MFITLAFCWWLVGKEALNNQPTNQPIAKPTNQSPTNQPTNQSPDQPTNQSPDQPTNQPTNQPPTNQSPNQSTNHQPTNQPPTNQSPNQSPNQPTNHQTNHQTNKQTNKPSGLLCCSEERSRRLIQPPHRSRSEGPLGRDLDDDSFLVSEYKTQYAWVRRPPSFRGPEAAPLLEAEKPPLHSTKNQVNINGVAGGASAGPAGVGFNDIGPVTDSQPAGDQQPRTPRKSKSMGRIHGGGPGPEVGGGGAAGGPAEASGGGTQQQHDPAPPAPGPDTAAPTQHWHRGHRRTPSDGVAWRHSKGLEADRIVGGEMFGEDDKLSKRAYKSEYRKKFRPFSQYQYVDGKFHKVKGEETAAAGGSESPNNWYKEVIELRRQAGQYRHRGWGVETASERLAEIYSKQAELWEQVSRRSSLQALSLASASPSSRPISKAEKEIENSRRSSPIKHVSKTSRERPSTAPPKPKPAAVHAQKAADKTDGKTSKESTPRHHYERTTAASEDGLLITSPSRDKLEPFIPDDWSSRRSARRTPPITSPVKDGPIRRKANRASSAARPPPTKDPRSSVGGRSVSVGPENRSPKRTSRPPSTHAPAPTTKPERRPRPKLVYDPPPSSLPGPLHRHDALFLASLSTSARRKGTDALPHRPSSHDEGRETKKASKAKPHDLTSSPKKGEDKSKVEKKHISEENDAKKDKEKEIIPKDGSKDAAVTSKEPVEALKESTVRKSTPEPRFDPEKYEPVVKTPPEPTRVKSPDQVMVKSPDPVNWTVPLDTGKTFTVTHNIPEGESARGTPSSEYRHTLESRTRQTPEPTKISQGSLVGTPVAAVTTEFKSQSQEQPKPTTATTVESKVDDKSLDKKPEVITSQTNLQDTKTTETKLPDDKPVAADTLSSKVDTDKKLSETKVADTKAADIKPIDSKVKEPISSQPEIPVVKPADPKLSAVKPVVLESKPSEPVVPESKAAPETKKPDPIPEPKTFSAQPSQQMPPQQHVAPPSSSAPTQASPLDIIPPSGISWDGSQNSISDGACSSLVATSFDALDNSVINESFDVEESVVPETYHHHFTHNKEYSQDKHTSLGSHSSPSSVENDSAVYSPTSLHDDTHSQSSQLDGLYPSSLHDDHYHSSHPHDTEFPILLDTDNISHSLLNEDKPVSPTSDFSIQSLRKDNQSLYSPLSQNNDLTTFHKSNASSLEKLDCTPQEDMFLTTDETQAPALSLMEELSKTEEVNPWSTNDDVPSQCLKDEDIVPFSNSPSSFPTQIPDAHFDQKETNIPTCEDKPETPVIEEVYSSTVRSVPLFEEPVFPSLKSDLLAPSQSEDIQSPTIEHELATPYVEAKHSTEHVPHTEHDISPSINKHDPQSPYSPISVSGGIQSPPLHEDDSIFNFTSSMPDFDSNDNSISSLVEASNQTSLHPSQKQSDTVSLENTDDEILATNLTNLNQSFEELDTSSVERSQGLTVKPVNVDDHVETVQSEAEEEIVEDKYEFSLVVPSEAKINNDHIETTQPEEEEDNEDKYNFSLVVPPEAHNYDDDIMTRQPEVDDEDDHENKYEYSVVVTPEAHNYDDDIMTRQAEDDEEDNENKYEYNVVVTPEAHNYDDDIMTRQPEVDDDEDNEDKYEYNVVVTPEAHNYDDDIMTRQPEVNDEEDNEDKYEFSLVVPSESPKQKYEAGNDEDVESDFHNASFEDQLLSSFANSNQGLIVKPVNEDDHIGAVQDEKHDEENVEDEYTFNLVIPSESIKVSEDKIVPDSSLSLNESFEELDTSVERSQGLTVKPVNVDDHVETVQSEAEEEIVEDKYEFSLVVPSEAKINNDHIETTQPEEEEDNEDKYNFSLVVPPEAHNYDDDIMTRQPEVDDEDDHENKYEYSVVVTPEAHNYDDDIMTRQAEDDEEDNENKYEYNVVVTPEAHNYDDDIMTRQPEVDDDEDNEDKYEYIVVVTPEAHNYDDDIMTRQPEVDDEEDNEDKYEFSLVVPSESPKVLEQNSQDDDDNEDDLNTSFEGLDTTAFVNNSQVLTVKSVNYDEHVETVQPDVDGEENVDDKYEFNLVVPSQTIKDEYQPENNVNIESEIHNDSFEALYTPSFANDSQVLTVKPVNYDDHIETTQVEVEGEEDTNDKYNFSLMVPSEDHDNVEEDSVATNPPSLNCSFEELDTSSENRSQGLTVKPVNVDDHVETVQSEAEEEIVEDKYEFSLVVPSEAKINNDHIETTQPEEEEDNEDKYNFSLVVPPEAHNYDDDIMTRQPEVDDEDDHENKYEYSVVVTPEAHNYDDDIMTRQAEDDEEDNENKYEYNVVVTPEAHNYDDDIMTRQPEVDDDEDNEDKYEYNVVVTPEAHNYDDDIMTRQPEVNDEEDNEDKYEFSLVVPSESPKQKYEAGNDEDVESDFHNASFEDQLLSSFANSNQGLIVKPVNEDDHIGAVQDEKHDEENVEDEYTFNLVIPSESIKVSEDKIVPDSSLSLNESFEELDTSVERSQGLTVKPVNVDDHVETVQSEAEEEIVEDKYEFSLVVPSEAKINNDHIETTQPEEEEDNEDKYNFSLVVPPEAHNYDDDIMTRQPEVDDEDDHENKYEYSVVVTPEAHNYDDDIMTRQAEDDEEDNENKYEYNVVVTPEAHNYDDDIMTRQPEVDDDEDNEDKYEYNVVVTPEAHNYDDDIMTRQPEVDDEEDNEDKYEFSLVVPSESPKVLEQNSQDDDDNEDDLNTSFEGLDTTAFVNNSQVLTVKSVNYDEHVETVQPDVDGEENVDDKYEFNLVVPSQTIKDFGVDNVANSLSSLNEPSEELDTLSEERSPGLTVKSISYDHDVETQQQEGYEEENTEMEDNFSVVDPLSSLDETDQVFQNDFDKEDVATSSLNVSVEGLDTAFVPEGDQDLMENFKKHIQQDADIIDKENSAAEDDDESYAIRPEATPESFSEEISQHMNKDTVLNVPVTEDISQEIIEETENSAMSVPVTEEICQVIDEEAVLNASISEENSQVENEDTDLNVPVTEEINKDINEENDTAMNISVTENISQDNNQDIFLIKPFSEDSNQHFNEETDNTATSVPVSEEICQVNDEDIVLNAPFNEDTVLNAPVTEEISQSINEVFLNAPFSEDNNQELMDEIVSFDDQTQEMVQTDENAPSEISELDNALDIYSIESNRGSVALFDSDATVGNELSDKEYTDDKEFEELYNRSVLQAESPVPVVDNDTKPLHSLDGFDSRTYSLSSHDLPSESINYDTNLESSAKDDDAGGPADDDDAVFNDNMIGDNKENSELGQTDNLSEASLNYPAISSPSKDLSSDDLFSQLSHGVDMLGETDHMSETNDYEAINNNGHESNYADKSFSSSAMNPFMYDNDNGEVKSHEVSDDEKDNAFSNGKSSPIDAIIQSKSVEDVKGNMNDNETELNGKSHGSTVEVNSSYNPFLSEETW